MFLGHQETKVDDRGRLKLSSEFKAVADEKYGNKFYITSLDGRRAQIYPLQEWMKKLEQLDGMPKSSRIRQRILEVTSRYGDPADMDAQGRLLLPQRLREEAKLMGEVMVFSLGSSLEVANLAEFNDSAKPLTAEELAEASANGW